MIGKPLAGYNEYDYGKLSIKMIFLGLRPSFDKSLTNELFRYVQFYRYSLAEKRKWGSSTFNNGSAYCGILAVKRTNSKISLTLLRK